MPSTTTLPSRMMVLVTMPPRYLHHLNNSATAVTKRADASIRGRERHFHKLRGAISAAVLHDGVDGPDVRDALDGIRAQEHDVGLEPGREPSAALGHAEPFGRAARREAQHFPGRNAGLNVERHL